MSGEEVSAYLSAARWGEETRHLAEFARHYELPQVARVVKGQYRHVPHSLNQLVLLTSAGPRLKVAAQCVKFKEGRRVQPVSGARLAIPESYDGWFEILSEEGRSARCIEGVAELARRAPSVCLVRDPVKCFVGKADDPETMSDKSKVLPAGESLTLAGEVTGPTSWTKGRRCLKCYTSKGEPLYLGMDQRCRFSAVAGDENISGVHTIRALLRKRLPMMVRLVHGKPPPGLKTFVQEMRLQALFQEERTLVAIPLLKDSPQALALAPGLPVKLQGPRNADALLKMREHGRLREWSQRLAQEAADRMHALEPHKRNSTPSAQHQQHRSAGTQRSLSDPCEPFSDRQYEEIDQIYDYVRGFAPLPERIKSDFAPDTANVEPPVAQPVTESPPTVPSQEDSPPNEPEKAPEEDKKKEEEKVEKPPEPPPIETIPARRASTGDTAPSRKVQHLYEKVQTRLPTRSNSASKMTSPSKIFQKSCAQPQRPRLFKHSKSSPALKEPRAAKKPSSSPLFHIRYKSLTNLMDLNNTLDSSHSGQTSSGSAGSVAKRSKLPRPKSLTNLLLWEDSRNKYNILQSKFIFPPNKRLGTLYL